ncbi:MAG: hypothetical protein ACRDDF_03125 [Aeromonas sp.]
MKVFGIIKCKINIQEITSWETFIITELSGHQCILGTPFIRRNIHEIILDKDHFRLKPKPEIQIREVITKKADGKNRN